MKEIIKTYGDMLIACVIILALISVISALTLFGSTGITAISGGFFEKRLNADVGNEGYKTVAFDAYKTLKASEIVFDSSSEIYAGENRKVSEIFMTDGGERTGYQVIAIYGENGEIFSCETRTADEELCFENPGIYTVYCKAGTVKGISKITRLTIPVNRRNSL